jgi:O-antigen/teichoic acid export membrane protein
LLDKLKYTLKHSVIYGLGSLSAKALGFILLPIYFHYLTIEQYGILAIFEITAQIMTEVLIISIPTSLIRWYAAEKDLIQKKSIVFTSFSFIILVALLLSILLIPFSEYFSFFFFDSINYSEEFTYLFLWVSLSLIDRMVLSLLRVKQKSIFYIGLSLFKILTILSFNIYFIVFLDLGLEGILLSQVLGHALIILISSVIVVRNSNLSFNFSIMLEMLEYGFPLIFSTISSLILSLGDRYLIKIFLGDAAVGVYNAGFKIASLINMMINQPFQLGFLPIAFAQFEKPGSLRFYSKVLTYLTLVITGVFIFVGFFGGLVIELITDKTEYLQSIVLIPFIALSFVFKGVQYMLGLSFHYVKRTKYNAYLVMLASVLNVGLNIILIPKYGLMASVLSMNFSMIILILLTYYFAQKEYFIPYEIFKVSLVITFGITLVGAIIYLPVENFYVSISIKILFTLLFPIILYRSNFFEKIEKDRMSQSWKKWKSPKNWKNNISKIKIN